MVAEVGDLRGIVETVKSDSELQTILDIAYRHIPSSASGNTAFLAHLYKSASLLLMDMKTNGELPELNKIGSVQAQNRIDILISKYDSMFTSEMAKMVFGGFDKSSYVISRKCPYVRSLR